MTTTTTTKYELELSMTIIVDDNDVHKQPVTLVLESFDKVMLRTDTHLYILQSTKEDRETGSLKALHDIFLCKQHPHTPSLPITFANDSWFKMEELKSERKMPNWVFLKEVEEPTMQIFTAVVTWGWSGHKGMHSANDLFTFIRVERNC